MIIFPNCKINLGLRVLRKRTDGYHDLETIFYPLPVRDALEVIRSEKLHFSSTGIPIPGNETSNLCLKAYHLLKKDFPELPPVHIHLHKHIPIGAGLGGGSSDGAATLTLLNNKFQLGLDTTALLQYAAILGSDCPFFVLNKPSLATGRGEQLTPLELDLSHYTILLVNPGIHISTPWAFSRVKPSETGASLAELIQQPVETWSGRLINDFEEPVMREYPVLRKIRDELDKAGALYAALSGSGSTFFGIFNKLPLPYLSFEENFQTLLLT